MIEKELLDNQVETEFVNLGEIKMSHCLGCGSCYKTGHCCLNDDAETLSKKIADADGLVIGSPTYASNVSGILKNFIDRGHFVIEQLLHDKYCINIATEQNYGNKNTLKVLDDLVLYSGENLSAHLLVKAPFNHFDEAEKRMSSKIHTVSNRFIKDIQSKKIYPAQKVFKSVIFNIGIRPFVKKKGLAYHGVMEKWDNIGIQLK